MADVKLAYAASSNLTVTNLHSLPASPTWVAGWESGAIDNTNKYLDYRITAKLVTAASNTQAGEVRLYLIGMLDDSTWPDVFDGTESTETLTAAVATNVRDAICLPGAMTTTVATASQTYYLDCPSAAAVFGGNLPAKFVIFITGNAATSTNAQFASSGNQVTVKGVYATVA